MSAHDETQGSEQRPERSLKAKEAAFRLSLSDESIKQMCERGILKCHLTGPHLTELRVLESSLRAHQQMGVPSALPERPARRRDLAQAIEKLRQRGCFAKKG